METEKQAQKLADAVLAYVISGGGVESVSYIHRSLGQDGWRGLGCLADFESKCRSLGFTVAAGKNDRGQARTEVRL